MLGGLVASDGLWEYEPLSFGTVRRFGTQETENEGKQLRTTKVFESVLSAILTLSVAGVATVYIVNQLRPGRLPGQRPIARDTLLDDWQRLADVGIRLGSHDAPVTVIEFMDFECPFCAEFVRTMSEIKAEYGEEVSIVFHHLPLGMHRFARPAAIAAECAAAQGRFEAMFDQLFERPDSFGLKPWRDYATDAGVVDLEIFDVCLKGDSFAQIELGIEEARRIGANATPTVIVNGWKLAHPPTATHMREMIEAIRRGEQPGSIN